MYYFTCLSTTAMAEKIQGGCAIKAERIQKEIDYAKKYGNKHRIAGLEKALSEVKDNCTEASMQAEHAEKVLDKEKKVNEKQQKVAERERELAEATAKADLKKAAKKKQKLVEAQADLKKAQAELKAVKKEYPLQ